MPTCSACQIDRPSDFYSSAQLKKKQSRRCKICLLSDYTAEIKLATSVSPDSVTSTSSSSSYRITSSAESQLQFTTSTKLKDKVSKLSVFPLHPLIPEIQPTKLRTEVVNDDELQEAIKYGQRCDFKDEGVVHFVYKHVVYMLDADCNVCITAWRAEPAQCICKLQRPVTKNPCGRMSDAEMSEDICERMKRRDMLTAKIQLALIRATSTDPGRFSACAAELEKIDFSHPKNRDMLTSPFLQGLLLLGAACMLVNMSLISLLFNS